MNQEVFFIPTSMNDKYEIVSYIEIKEAGRNYGGSNIVEYQGKPFFNLTYHYLVDKKTLETIKEKYSALSTYM